MKKYLIPFLLGAFALAAVSCEDVEEAAAVVPEVKVLSQTPIPWSGMDTYLLTLSANVEIRAEKAAADSWLQLLGVETTNRSAGTRVLVCSAEENPAKSERTADVRILSRESGEQLLLLSLVQLAAEEPYLEVRSAPEELSYAGEDAIVSVTSNVEYEVQSDADWLHIVTVDAGTVTLRSDENTELEARSATLTFLFHGQQLATLPLSQKGRPSAGIRLERVWGKYAATDALWYQRFGMAVGQNQDRFIAMDADYIYISRIANNNPGDSWGIAVLDRKTGDFVKDMRDNAGIEKVGLWAVSAMQVVDDGQGGTVLVACNMSRSNELNILKIYAWTDIDAAPQVVTYSYADAHNNSRLGDKMGVSGNWQEGELYFVDYFAPASQRAMLIFKMEGGRILPNPIDTSFGDNLSGASNMATLAPLGGDKYLYYGTSASTEFYACIVSRNGNRFSQSEFSLLPSRGFDAVMNGFQTLRLAGQPYLLWLTHDRNSSDRSGFVRTLMLEEEDFAEGIRALTSLNAAESYPMASDSMTNLSGLGNGNNTGDMALRQIDGEWYLAVISTGSGVSLFRIVAL